MQVVAESAGRKPIRHPGYFSLKLKQTEKIGKTWDFGCGRRVGHNSYISY